MFPLLTLALDTEDTETSELSQSCYLLQYPISAPESLEPASTYEGIVDQAWLLHSMSIWALARSHQLSSSASSVVGIEVRMLARGPGTSLLTDLV